jgi:16S rRNA (guanine527-N7)-methyltransferase
LNLQETAAYVAYGVSDEAIAKLGHFGDLLLSSPVNVTSIRDPSGVEHLHFLDSLSLLTVPEISEAGRLVDVGSGGGLPAIVLALALPGLKVVAVESIRKKCAFIEEAGLLLGLSNLRVECARAEDLGHSGLRESFDAAVTRAVAPMAVVAEICLPLVRVGGVVVTMKGPMSDQERIQGQNALAILGAVEGPARQVQPFPGVENRWLHVARKASSTPPDYPRRPGVPQKRPLGAGRADGGRRS